MAMTRREARALGLLDPRPTGPVQVLVVCTANLVRSPFVERLLADELERRGARGIAVKSAGTYALPGVGLPDELATMAMGRGLDLRSSTGTQIDETVLEPVRTVLCAAREHKQAVLRIRPDMLRRVFTVREFARAIATAPAAVPGPEAGERWIALADYAADHRAAHAVIDPTLDDIIDPYRRGADEWREFEAVATAAVTDIAIKVTQS